MFKRSKLHKFKNYIYIKNKNVLITVCYLKYRKKSLSDYSQYYLKYMSPIKYHNLLPTFLKIAFSKQNSKATVCFRTGRDAKLTVC